MIDEMRLGSITCWYRIIGLWVQIASQPSTSATGVTTLEEQGESSSAGRHDHNPTTPNDNLTTTFVVYTFETLIPLL
jgi:hypothetical protein